LIMQCDMCCAKRRCPLHGRPVLCKNCNWLASENCVKGFCDKCCISPQCTVHLYPVPMGQCVMCKKRGKTLDCAQDCCRVCCRDKKCMAHSEYYLCKNCNNFKTQDCIYENCEYCCRAEDCFIHNPIESPPTIPICNYCNYWNMDENCTQYQCRSCCRDPACYHFLEVACVRCTNNIADSFCPEIKCCYCCLNRKCPVHAHKHEWCMACNERVKSRLCPLNRCSQCCNLKDCPKHTKHKKNHRLREHTNILDQKKASNT